MAENQARDWRVWAGGAAVVVFVGILLYLVTDRNRLEDGYRSEIAMIEADRDRIQGQLDEQIETSGSLAALNEEINTLMPQAEDLARERDAAQDEVDALTEQRRTLEAQIAEREAAQAEAEQAVTSLEEELRPLRDEIETFETRRDALADDVILQTEELSQIAARVEDARQQEAELAETLAALSEDRARLTQEVADAEERRQTALDEEAGFRTAIENARAEIGRLEDQRGALETEVADLEDRRTFVSDELAAAEAQLAEVQALVADVSRQVENRAERLAAIESDIAALLPTGGVNRSMLEPGSYRVDDVTVSFSQDGSFSIEGGKASGATGTFRLTEGTLELVSADGNGDTARCGFEQTESGFSLAGERKDCRGLEGMEFVRDAAE